MVDEDKVMFTASVRRLWEIIRRKLDRKLDSVEKADESIVIISGRRIAAKLSAAEDNILRLNKEYGKEGLYVPKARKLIFGADKYYKYDGTEDIIVPVYMGGITNK